jgi:hypothetical protein
MRGIRNKDGCSFLFCRPSFSLRKHLANQLIAFSALRLHRFAGCLPGDFSFTLFAFPPFEEVGAGAIVPDIFLPARSKELIGQTWLGR